MTQSELERAVCRATGESRQTIRRYGFGLVEEQAESLADPALVLDCPGCGAPSRRRTRRRLISSNARDVTRSTPSPSMKSTSVSAPATLLPACA